MEAGRPLCLSCADLDHLVYLPRGDTALTRRARKHSSLSAVVVRFSRSRKRYERQGVLVEETALDRAEQECSADADERRVKRELAEAYRDKQDQILAMRMAESIRQMFPGCPRALEEEALQVAVIAAVRHRHTNYDRLLMRGVGRIEARDAVRDQIDCVLENWRRARGGWK
jgi:hypothetical protein